MTDGTANRVLPLLAASGLTSSEIREFMVWVKQTSVEDAVRVFIRTRNKVKNLDAFETDDGDGTERYRTTSNTVAKDVDKLIKDSEFSVQEAVFRISTLLEKDYPERGDPSRTFSAKEGFRRWVTRMSNRYGDSAFLSAAIIALDKKREADWRLG